MVTEPLFLLRAKVAQLVLDGPIIFQIQMIVVCWIFFVPYVGLLYRHEVFMRQKIEQESPSLLDGDILTKMAS